MLEAPAKRFQGLNSGSLATSMSALTFSRTLLPLASIVSLLSSVNLFEHVNSRLTVRTTSLTSSSHPPQPYCLLMYHALLSTLLITTSPWLSSKSSLLFRPSSHLFFPSHWLNRSSGLHQSYSRFPTHSEPSIFLGGPLAC